MVEERAGEEPDYALPEEHWVAARNILLKDQQIPIVPLVSFLYRDLAFETEVPALDPLLDRFAREFNYGEEDGALKDEFHYLFSGPSDGFDPSEWFESYHGELSPEASTADSSAHQTPSDA